MDAMKFFKIFFAYFLILLSVSFVSCHTACKNIADEKILPKSDFLNEMDDPEDPVCIIRTNYGDIYAELFIKETPLTTANFIGLAEGEKFFSEPISMEKVQRPFYDGLTFHRVVKDLMIQGGDPIGSGRGGPGYTIKDEINADSLGLDKISAWTEKKGPNKYLGIKNQPGFEKILIKPLLKKMNIENRKEFEKNKNKVKKRLSEMSLKDVYENLGYEYLPFLKKSHHPKKGSLLMAGSGPNTAGSQFFINMLDTPWLTGKHTVFGKVVRGMDVVEKISRVPVNENQTPLSPVRIIKIRQIPNPRNDNK